MLLKNTLRLTLEPTMVLIGKRRKAMRFEPAEREGIAMATARQWLRTIKSKAQVRRVSKSIQQLRAEVLYSGKVSKRGKAIMHRHKSENPFNFALSPESQAILATTDDIEKAFGPILEPSYEFRARRGRRSALDKLIPELPEDGDI